MWSFIFSYILLPIPSTDIISSLLLNAFDDLYSIILSAITSPIPFKVFRSSTEAVLILIRPVLSADDAGGVDARPSG